MTIDISTETPSTAATEQPQATEKPTQASTSVDPIGVKILLPFGADQQGIASTEPFILFLFGVLLVVMARIIK